MRQFTLESSCSRIFLKIIKTFFSDIIFPEANLHKAQLTWSYVTASVGAKMRNMSVVLRLNTTWNDLVRWMILVNLSWTNYCTLTSSFPHVVYFPTQPSLGGSLCTCKLVVGPSKQRAIVGLWLRCISGLYCLLKIHFLEFKKKRIGMFR